MLPALSLPIAGRRIRILLPASQSSSGVRSTPPLPSRRSCATWRRSGTPEVIRTPDLLLRRQTLYPSELRARKLHFSVTRARSSRLCYHAGTRPVAISRRGG